MDYLFRKMFFMLLIIFVNIKDVTPKLHIRRMYVPEVITTKQPTWLECDYAGGGDKIYALKWYLGLDEFYRWTPAETPEKKTFPILNNPIEVDLEASYEGRVRVRSLSLEANGVYRCEVSAETPSFHTDSQTSNIEVIDLPDARPVITGVQRSYQLHEGVRLNCSSHHSYPIANLTFYVNNEKADPSWLVPYKALGDYSSPLQTAVLGIEFILWPNLLKKGSVVIKCTSEVRPLYLEQSEAHLKVDIPQHSSVMEGRSSSADWLLSAKRSWILASTTGLVSFLCLAL